MPAVIETLLNGLMLGALYALGDAGHPWNPAKEPLILVHGILSKPEELTDLVQIRLR